MYLHVGQNVVVPMDSIIGIFDTDKTTQSYITRAFLSRAEKEGCIINVSEDLPNSFVIVSVDGQFRVYLSQLSSATLFKRCEAGIFE